MVANANSNVVLDHCERKELPFLDLGEVTPKGFDHAIRVYELKWEEA